MGPSSSEVVSVSIPYMQSVCMGVVQKMHGADNAERRSISSYSSRRTRPRPLSEEAASPLLRSIERTDKEAGFKPDLASHRSSCSPFMSATLLSSSTLGRPNVASR